MSEPTSPAQAESSLLPTAGAAAAEPRDLPWSQQMPKTETVHDSAAMGRKGWAPVKLAGAEHKESEKQR